MDFCGIFTDSSNKLCEKNTLYFLDNPAFIQDLLAFISTGKTPQCVRASKVFERIIFYNSEYGYKFLSEIIHLLLKTSISGIRRNMLRCLTRLDTRWVEDYSFIIDQCFDWLHSKEEAAIKIYCLDILYAISIQFPDFQIELILSLEILIKEDKKPSVIGRSTHYFNKLQKLQKP